MSGHLAVTNQQQGVYSRAHLPFDHTSLGLSYDLVRDPPNEAEQATQQHKERERKHGVESGEYRAAIGAV